MRFDHIPIAYSLEMLPPLHLLRVLWKKAPIVGTLARKLCRLPVLLISPDPKESLSLNEHRAVPCTSRPTGQLKRGRCPPAPRGQAWQHVHSSSRGRCPRCPTVRLSRCSRLPYLTAGEEPSVDASLLVGDCSHCRGLDPGTKPAKQLGSKQNQAGSSSKSQLSPIALILHLACCSVSLLLSHFLMHFCLATKHELCYQRLIS